VSPDSSNQKIVHTQDGDCLVITIPPIVDLDDLAQVIPPLRRLAGSSGVRKVRIDCSKMAAVNHAGVALVQELRLQCQNLNKDFQLDYPSLALRQSMKDLNFPPREPEPDPDDTSQMSWIEAAGHITWNLYQPARQVLHFIGDLTQALAEAVVKPHRIRWRETFQYMARCGADALPIITLICFLMGMILGFQAALQLQQFGADTFVADLVGLSIIKELGPLMVAMVSTGRAGSAFAAEIGTMKVNEEVDALVAMGMDPQRFLIVPKVLALMAMMPILTIYGDLMGVLGGMFVGVVKLDLPVVAYLGRTADAVAVANIMEGLIKSVVFALLISSVGCLRGLQTKSGAQGVGLATTSAVVSGIFLVVVSDSVLTWIFSTLGFGV